MGLRCTACGESWPKGLDLCPHDGTQLLEESEVPTGVRTTAPTVTPTDVDPPRFPEGELAPGTRVGDYQVDRKIGEGAMGTVYAATHTLIAKKAALKVVSASLGHSREAEQRFIQEARAVNEIGHPNIVDIFAFGQLEDGRCYLVMELLKGQSLFERLARGQPMLSETIEILWQICLALEAAHKKGIIHRDLKPENVFLVKTEGPHPVVKLLDFGLAKLKTRAAPVHSTTAGVVMGTPCYMSPEQGRGGEVDHRTDLYALGVMAFELVFGEVPFDGDTPVDTVHMHLHNLPPPPRSLWRDIPDPLDRMITGLLAKDPAHRPSLAQVKAALTELRMQVTALVVPPRRARLRRRGRTPWVMGGLAVGVAVVLASAMVGQKRSGDRAAAEAAAGIRQQIAEGHLITPPRDSACDRFAAASARLPGRRELEELAGPLASSLKEAGIKAVRARRLEEGLKLLSCRSALAPPDEEITAAVRKAETERFAIGNGMVSVGEFWIDRYEYPNRKGARPTTQVDWKSADELCKAAGKRLCTEGEWAQACAGAARSDYPYGSTYNAKSCATGSNAGEPSPSGSRPDCVTSEGVADLSGNVAEWTASDFRPGSPQKVIRGGHWEQSGERVSCSSRDYWLPGQGGARHIGFRCCR